MGQGSPVGGRYVGRQEVQKVMGCDIHAYVEIIEDKITICECEYFLNRNYGMFGYLAGVRSLDDPVVEPRGLPDNLSWYLASEYEDGGASFHTPSYLSVMEYGRVLVAYMRDKECRHTRPKEYLALLALMVALTVEGVKCRLVFWFDN